MYLEWRRKEANNLLPPVRDESASVGVARGRMATAESARRGRDLKWESWTRYEMGDGRDAIWFMEEDNTLLRWRAQRR